LLTAEDAKLQSLNLAILFMIADIFWVKKTRQMHGILGYKKLATEISFTPFLSFTLAKISFTLG